MKTMLRNIKDSFHVLFWGRDHFVRTHCSVHERIGDQLDSYFDRLEHQREREFDARYKAIREAVRIHGGLTKTVWEEVKALERFYLRGEIPDNKAKKKRSGSSSSSKE